MSPEKLLPAVASWLVLVVPAFTQQIATFRPEVAPANAATPVGVNLARITKVKPDKITLLEVSAEGSTPVPFQVTDGMLCWILNPGATKYELRRGTKPPANRVAVVDKDGSLTIEASGKPLLQYHYATVYPPEGVDSAYKRSGFIHPLWSPHGQVLTRIQPKDHYHHYGIWNPWTHVLYEGDTVDFWNLRGRKGTVRFAKLESTTSGPVFGGYRVLHEHVVLRGDEEEVALNELQTVRIYAPDNEPYYLVDLTFEMKCATESPVHLLEYRYGGLGWRTTEEWNKDNSKVITSEGKTRRDADGSKARWCIVEGEVGGDYAGVVMMSHPTNYNHPEPLRIWPENQYGRGDMFANFSPTRDTDWLLEPGKTYVLKYRLLVYNGPMTAAKAEAAWQAFVTPPAITTTTN
ncbi:MAG TPA: PmoA family protein [Cyclobacteriaceae bacterium]